MIYEIIVNKDSLELMCAGQDESEYEFHPDLDMIDYDALYNFIEEVFSYSIDIPRMEVESLLDDAMNNDIPYSTCCSFDIGEVNDDRRLIISNDEYEDDSNINYNMLVLILEHIDDEEIKAAIKDNLKIFFL